MNEYSCAACPKKFSKKEELHVHFKEMHSFEARQTKRAKLSEVVVDLEPQPGPSRKDTSIPLRLSTSSYSPTRLDGTSPNLINGLGSDGTSPILTSESESGGTSPNPNIRTRRSNRTSPSHPPEPIHVHGLTCPFCNVEYKNMSSLRNHMEMHKSVKPFQCPTCLRAYETELKVLEHAILAHNLDAGFKCGGCDATYKTKRGLENHQHSKNCHEPLLIDISDD